MSIHRSRGRVGLLALAAILSVPVTLGVTTAAASAATAPCKVVRVGKAGSTANLQGAIDAAPAKATLIVTGTCTGSFTIGKDLTIRKGAKPATLRGGGRVLHVTAGSVTLSGLRITNGSATDCPIDPGLDACGGAILNEGSLRLVGMSVTGNRTESAGGTMFGAAIANASDATLRIGRSTISSNTSRSVGLSAYGGAIFNLGTLAISRSRLTGNRAEGTNAYGGALFQEDSGTATISDSIISGNSAAGSGGVEGGAIEAYGTLTIARSLLSGNVADTGTGYGGALYHNPLTTLTIKDSTFVGNRARRGGAIDASGALTILGSTIVRNTATDDEGGGIAGDWNGMKLGSTIIALNSAPTSPDCAVSTPETSLGHNLIGNNKDCNAFVNGVNNDRVGTNASPLNPKLGKLLANGGPTKTLALLKGSPALNKGGSAPCDTKTDQRGVKRPQFGKCDIGAYEKR